MKIGLLFGSFNPIHIGHVAIAKYMADKTDLEQVWMIVSPQNPLKEKKSLANGKKRLAQAKKAIGRNPKIKVSDVELKLPQPSYTINTLEVLKKQYPEHKFVLIIGSDNLNLFLKWKDYKKILSGYKIYVYPRSASDGGKLKSHKNVKFFDAPQLDVSSTFIREAIKKGKDISHLVPAK